jgi:two-component system chemotaxis response regulator CheB
VHVAPPGHHLIIRSPGRCVLDASPPLHRVRPSADVTFASAARTYRDRTLGVVLTGYGVDAAAGASMIRRNGGVVLVQDPQTCQAAAMPEAAIALGAPHLILPLSAVASAIASLVGVRGTAQLFGFRQTAEEPFPRLPVRRIGVA